VSIALGNQEIIVKIVRVTLQVALGLIIALILVVAYRAPESWKTNGAFVAFFLFLIMLLGPWWPSSAKMEESRLDLHADISNAAAAQSNAEHVTDRNQTVTKSILLSKKETFWVFVYSLIFLGTTIPPIAVLCIFAVLPFTGGAWMSGVAAVSFFKTNTAYLPAAWLAVFLQAYFVASLTQLFKRRRKKLEVSKAKSP
jgi:hypothetical protein